MKLLSASILCLLAAPSTAFVNRMRADAKNRLFLPAISRDTNESDEDVSLDSVTRLALASLISFALIANPLPAFADGQTVKFKLPPIDMADKNRCTLKSSSMGQANAARDKLYDLRQCSLSGANAAGYDLSGVIMSKTDVSKANFQEAYFSKGYLQGTCVWLCFVFVISCFLLGGIVQRLL